MTSAKDRDAHLRGLLAELARLQASEDHLSAEVQELRESRDTLEVTLAHYIKLHELSAVACLSLDGGGNIVGANQRAVSLLGVSAGTLGGSPFFYMLGTADRRRFVEHAVISQESNASASFETLLLRSLMSRIPVRLSVRATNEPEIAYVVTLVDLREREAAVAERDQMAHEGRVVRQENQNKNLQIAMLTRGLRAPLTPVLAAASKLAEKGELNPDIHAPLRDLVTAIAALQQGIRRVGPSAPRRARDPGSSKLKLRADERGHRRRYRAAR